MIKKLIVLGVMMMFLSTATAVFAEDVFVTKGGKKYHKETCRLIKKKDALKAIEKEAGLEKGYKPCRSCFKEDVVIEEKAK